MPFGFPPESMFTFTGIPNLHHFWCRITFNAIGEALNDFFVKQKPERVLLRDHTFVRRGATDALNNMYSRDVPEEATVNFDSRNKTQAKIGEGQIKAQVEINLLAGKVKLPH